MHPSIISANDLKLLIGKNLVILDCRFNLQDKLLGQTQYRDGHIPGAYYLDLEHDLSSTVHTHGGRHPLPDMEKLAEKFRSCGISSHSTVVIYDDSRFAYASRAWWLLNFMGHRDVKILDGGFKAWLAINGAVDRREPALKLGNFKAEFESNWTVDRDAILAEANLQLIDSREAPRYQGIHEPIDPIAGHIPGAVNYFWQDISDDSGFIKPIAWQQQHWSALKNELPIAVYCGSGVTACVNLFSMHLCGIDAKLYPGSWSDWCSYLTNTNI